MANMIVLRQLFTLDELKAAYRAAVKKTHPDMGGTESDFRAIQTEYERLLLLAQETGADGKDSTIDGTPLSELGMGLGPTKNGKECLDCNGKGYNEYRSGSNYVPCPNTVHMINRRCALCGDTACSNRWSWWFGRKEHWVRSKKKIIYHKCSHCKGTGEVEIFNPAFPKGFITEK